MLQLKHVANGFELADKSAKAILSGASIKIKDQTFTAPGEYESDNIEAVYGEHACLIVWEHLQIVYVFASGTPSLFEKDQFSSSDVVVIGGELTDVNRVALDEWLDACDPKIVAVSPHVKLEESAKNSLKFQDNPTIKLAAASLPEEGREFYVNG